MDDTTSTEETEETTLETELSDEVTEEELSEEEEDEATSEEPEVLYAGKYDSVEELEKAYNESSAGGKGMAAELKSLKDEISQLKMTPEEKAAADQNRKFIDQNGLMTKVEFVQMQKDDREAGDLLDAGATKRQLDRVKQVANFGDFSKMSLTEVYRDLYGAIPRLKPKQGVSSKSRAKSVKSKQYTQADIDAMSSEQYKENRADIMARGVKR